ncbi:MAG: ICEBs1 excisionase [Lachnospiraceae bacterium]|nr:ICEBs1 excisionase [Lachnospiraceae bacterium]
MDSKKIYLTASEVSELLGVSMGHSYKLIQKMNKELKDNGFLTIAGKIPRKYFEERYYGYIA